ncbi:MAG: AEC family transporter [Rhodocyclaceae bacterium]|nr:AEC family transporter [Rhodocyclaceae bacterium]
MSDFLAVVDFSLSVTGPIFVVLALGYWLMRRQLIDDAFVNTGSRLVFNVALPALLFISIGKTRFDAAADFDVIAFAVVATLIAWPVLEVLASRLVVEPRDRGVVVQGGFRSNMGIVGLAYCVNAYGDAGLVAASLYLAPVTIVFNVVAVVTLGRSLDRSQGIGPMLRSIVTNPLIIAIVLALPVSWLALDLPGWVLQSGQYFANLTLPLALLCTGAALNFRQLRREVGSTVLASVAKLVALPLLFVLGGLAWGFRGIDLGVLLLMSSAPTAAASYVMVRAMGGNATLAANIVALTTVGSILTTSIGVMMLRGLALM